MWLKSAVFLLLIDVKRAMVMQESAALSKDENACKERLSCCISTEAEINFSSWIFKNRDFTVLCKVILLPTACISCFKVFRGYQWREQNVPAN